MFRKILVPLDGSELAERAVLPAIELAKTTGAQLIFARVAIGKATLAEQMAGLSWLTAPEHLVESRLEGQSYLEMLATSRPFGDLPVRIKVLEGHDVAATLLDFAEHEGVDFILISSHGRTGLQRWLLGSIAQRIVNHATCPVMILRREIYAVENILLTLDGSGAAEVAIEYGKLLARCFSANLLLYHVDTQPNVELPEGDLPTPQQYLSQMAESIRAEGISADFHIAQGLAALAIINHSESNHYDLIVMATHGYTGEKRWALGSVTQKVLYSSHSNLLIIPPKLRSGD